LYVIGFALVARPALDREGWKRARSREQRKLAGNNKSPWYI